MLTKHLTKHLTKILTKHLTKNRTMFFDNVGGKNGWNIFGLELDCTYPCAGLSGIVVACWLRGSCRLDLRGSTPMIKSQPKSHCKSKFLSSTFSMFSGRTNTRKGKGRPSRWESQKIADVPCVNELRDKSLTTARAKQIYNTVMLL